MTELELHRNTDALEQQMTYARAVADGDLLPPAYKKKPANVLIAVGLGSAMGLTPAESLYRIDVIQGKPTASAELIASNVRKAGHRLRVETDEQKMSVTATIYRADDPEFPHSVTRDLDWAKNMGLLGKDNYKKQPLTMLEWRAISAVARKACSEALYGVGYTADEIADFPATPSQQTTGLASALADSEPKVTVEVGEPEPTTETALHITAQQVKKIATLMQKVDLAERDAALDYVARVTGRIVASRKELSKAEASQVIEALEADIASISGGQADPATEYDPTLEPGWQG